MGHVRIGFTWLSALKKELSEDRVNSSVHIAGKISQVNYNEKSNYKKKIKKINKKNVSKVTILKTIFRSYGCGKVPLESGFWATHCGT